eukprot:2062074-Rhodomonas_salina.2
MNTMQQEVWSDNYAAALNLKVQLAESPKRPDQIFDNSKQASSITSGEQLSPESSSVEILFCGIGDQHVHKLHAESLIAACQSKVENVENLCIQTRFQIYSDYAAFIDGIKQHQPTVLHITCFDQQQSKKLVQDLIVRDDEFLVGLRGNSSSSLVNSEEKLSHGVRMVTLDMHMSDLLAGVLIPALDFVVINSLASARGPGNSAPQDYTLRALQVASTAPHPLGNVGH